MDIWSIYITETSLHKFFNSKGKILFLKKKKIHSKKPSFFADPFIFKKSKKKITLLVEDFSFLFGGQISKIQVIGDKITKQKILSGKHFSYPFIFNNKNKNHLFPEMNEEKRNLMFTISKNKLKKTQSYLLGYKVIDPTIIKIKDYYWLFCSLKNKGENKNLYLFYSKSIFSDWIAHEKNPVIKNVNFARNAGNIIQYNGNFYRPSQLSKGENYGSAIIINKILKINNNVYKEKKVFSILSEKKYQGIHHLSYLNGTFAYDQKRIVYSIFKPIYYLIKSIKSLLNFT